MRKKRYLKLQIIAAQQGSGEETTLEEKKAPTKSKTKTASKSKKKSFWSKNE